MEVNEIVQQTLAALKVEEEAERKRQEEKDAYASQKVAEALEVAKKDFEEEAKAWKESKGEVATKRVTERGSGGTPEGGPMAAFTHWLFTGDVVAANKELTKNPYGDEHELGNAVDEETRKVLSSASGAAGEYLVPDDFVSPILAKRDDLSFPRKMGVRVYPTDLAVVDLPAEDTSLTKFVRTAESGTYDTNDPTFAQNQVTVNKWTKETRFSEEILEDNKAGLMAWYQDALARSMALTEAYYVAVGSGTNQHTGIFVGGDTDALTFNTDNGADSDGNLLLEGLWKLYFTLVAGYRTDAAWLCDDMTAALILGLAQSNEALFGAHSMTISGDQIMLLGKPLFTQGDIDTKSSGVCFLMFGSPYYYTLVERKGISVKRNDALYMASGQVGIFSSFRQSGTVTVETAWVGGVGA